MSDYSACQWPVSYVNCTHSESGDWGTGCSLLESLPDEERGAIEQFATDLLWEWTGRVFGLCATTVRPCRDSRADRGRPTTFVGRGPRVPLVHDGTAWERGWALTQTQFGELLAYCGNCGLACSCDPDAGLNSLRIPGPAQEIVEIKIDGEVVPEESYRLMYGSLLVRDDGEAWPSTQDLTLPDTAPDTFSITYLKGIEVPQGGSIAAGRLACELGKAFCNDSTCELPERIQTITRQGVTIGFADRFDGLEEGKVGIWVIDAWIASVKSPKPRAGVRSPDIRRTRGGSAW